MFRIIVMPSNTPSPSNEGVLSLDSAMMNPLVSVIIPTYNRPDTLRVAINSVVAQSLNDWELLVIGDHCDPRTGQVVQSFDDERISYINLPARFGEQSGPNSIGLVLAEGMYVAFLNHDDVYLQDHLKRAVDHLEEQGADFFVGRSVFARKSVPDDTFGAAPVFSEINPVGRSGRDSFTGHPILFEPSSAWVVRAETACAVGTWRNAATMHRTPAQQWVLRAWKKRARFVFGDLVTVLKLVTHYQYAVAAGNYGRVSAEHQYIDAVLRDQSPDETRRLVQKDLDAGSVDHWAMKAPWPDTPARQRLHGMLISRFMSTVYRYTGIDGYELYCMLVRKEKGDVLKAATKKRTGDVLPEPPVFSTILASVLAGRDRR